MPVVWPTRDDNCSAGKSAEGQLWAAASAPSPVKSKNFFPNGISDDGTYEHIAHPVFVVMHPVNTDQRSQSICQDIYADIPAPPCDNGRYGEGAGCIP